jgi:hypothetical protein
MNKNRIEIGRYQAPGWRRRRRFSTAPPRRGSADLLGKAEAVEEESEFPSIGKWIWRTNARIGACCDDSLEVEVWVISDSPAEADSLQVNAKSA